MLEYTVIVVQGKRKRENGKWPLGLSDFYITILSVIIVFSTLERYPFATPN